MAAFTITTACVMVVLIYGFRGATMLMAAVIDLVTCDRLGGLNRSSNSSPPAR